jgi:hypothetical protein
LGRDAIAAKRKGDLADASHPDPDADRETLRGHLVYFGRSRIA